MTTNGPYQPKPYYLRLTKDANPNAGTTYDIGDGGPTAADQRTVVDPSFLELVRLGVKAHDHPPVLTTLRVVDRQLAVDTPNGRFWHRFNFDGYGETRDGSPWDVSEPGMSRGTIGRIWPIFAGERGEYELLAGRRRAAQRGLAAMAGAANAGWMIPEQVWDQNAPSGRPGYPRGEGTLSAHAARLVARPVCAPGLVDPGRPSGGAPARRGLPLRELLTGTGDAQLLEQVEPDLRAGGKRRNGVEQPVQRNLSHDGNRRRLEELRHLRAGEGRADDQLPVLVHHQPARAGCAVSPVEARSGVAAGSARPPRGR